jgi:hypothetical protein
MDEYNFDYDGLHFNFKRNLTGSTADDSLVMVNVNCSLQHYDAVLCKLMDADYELNLGLFNHQVQLQPPLISLSKSAVEQPIDDQPQFIRGLDEMTSARPAVSNMPYHPEPPTAPHQCAEDCDDDSISTLMSLLQESVSKLGYHFSGEYSYSNSSYTYAIKLNGKVKSTATDLNLIEAQKKAAFAVLYKASPEAAIAWDAKYMK